MPQSPIARIAFALAGCAAFACAPAVQDTPPPTTVTFAVFDPTSGKIPLPNDIVLSTPVAQLGLAPAQAELISVFQAQHGFPNDQEVPITIDFATSEIDPNTGAVSQVAPDLDLTSFTATTLIVGLQTATGAAPVALDPLVASDYVKSSDHGELTIHHQGHLPWAPGEYAVFVRGGADGVKTIGGDSIYASPVFYLIEQGQDLTLPQNIGLLVAQTGSQAAALADAEQLNMLIAAYKPAFAGIDPLYPHTDLAVLDTFTIAPLVTQVQLDPNRGLVPLPIDLLRNPVQGGLLTPLAACTLASGNFNATTGACTTASGATDAAAAGFATLDGFSTTGAILAPTSSLLNASTVNAHTVFLFDLSVPTAPVEVDPTTYITEPVEFTSSGFAPLVGLQPAGATANDPTSIFRTKPLKDATDYAVVITDGVLDANGKPLERGTVANILLFTNALVNGSGTSQLSGVDDATAGALEVMRKQLAPVVTAAASLGVSESSISMAYTFHTETILSTATELGALVYQPTLPAALASPTTPTPAPGSATAAAAFAKYGVDATLVPGTGPNDHINEILESTLTTLNLLDPASGAFLSDATKAAPEQIDVLIATPKVTNANVPACSGPLAALGAAGLKCAPMVIFRHGFGGGRAQMLLIADSLNAQGMVVVAIDAAKHGDRSYCQTDADCIGGDTCSHTPALANQGDPAGATPGACVDATGAPGAFATHPVLCPSGGACDSAPDGIPNASSNFLISSNFFRTRDTLRQDIIDQSQLVHVLGFVPSGLPPTGNPVFDRMALSGVVIDPTQIFFVGQSLGSIQGTVDVAANPRITKADFNVGGGTIVDVFTNSPAFHSDVVGLLGALGITPGTSAYLQFLVVAKTILDPADPINFAGHLTMNTLPNLLTIATTPPSQAPKKVLTQIAYCDQTVPNPFEYLLAENIGTGPLPGFPGFIPPVPGVSAGSTGTFEIFIAGQTNFMDCPVFGGAALPPAAVDHAFLTNWDPPAFGNAGYFLTAEAQSDAAAFLADDTNPPSVQVPQIPAAP